MSDRLSRAVAELRAALSSFESRTLEEPTESAVTASSAGRSSPTAGGSERWEVVSPSSTLEEPAPQPKAKAKAKSRARSPVVEVPVVEVRYYLVFSNPGDHSSVGLWEGPHPQTWAALERTLRGGKLLGSGARLVRMPSRQAAVERWEREAPGENLPVHRP